MTNVYNFSAGPATLPAWVLEKAQKEFLNYGNSGQSVMEMSHRSGEYLAIIQQTENDLRELLAIPKDYKVLFLQGGASLQFSMIPMNCAQRKVQVIHTGEWTKKAIIEHQKIVNTEILASSEEVKFSYIPTNTCPKVDQNSDYLYICQNNTIFGTKYAQLPDAGEVPIVADVSSMILSEPMDISKYGLVFAGAQKNLGMAGLCLLILKPSMIINDMSAHPSMLSYQTYISSDSMFNTPPTYAIYISGLICRWLIQEIGGLTNMAKLNQEKARVLYDFLDQSVLFSNPVVRDFRSLMNVTFVTDDKNLDQLFIKEANSRGLLNLAGHRLIGGMRASIYNAMPISGVETLVAMMKDFEVQHG